LHADGVIRLEQLGRLEGDRLDRRCVQVDLVAILIPFEELDGLKAGLQFGIATAVEERIDVW
jgi:hypothetical protein